MLVQKNITTSTKNILIRIIPIVAIEIYLAATVLLFIYGPSIYNLINPEKFYTFIISAQVALLIGYLTSVFSTPKAGVIYINPQTVILLGSVVEILLFIPTLHARTGEFFPNLINAISDPGAAYNHSQMYRHNNQSFVEYILVFLGPLIVSTLPLTVFYWKNLTNIVQVLSTFAIFSRAALYIGTGTNKALADFLIIVPVMLYLASRSDAANLKTVKTYLKILILIIASIIFFSFFTSTQTTRQGATLAQERFEVPAAQSELINKFIDRLPDQISKGFYAIAFYLTHGYYAVYLALDLPFESTYGFGNSMFLSRQIDRIAPFLNISEQTYPFRLEPYGWNGFVNWSTIYCWIASDVSFPGTILVVFLIGRLLAQSWVESLITPNPITIAMFSQLVIMLAYFSANNQCLQTGDGFGAFWLTLLAWKAPRGFLRI